MIKTVIFDFDGTLADTVPVCFFAFKAVFINHKKGVYTSSSQGDCC